MFNFVVFCLVDDKRGNINTKGPDRVEPTSDSEVHRCQVQERVATKLQESLICAVEEVCQV